MAHERPTDDLRGTEPARQSNDPALTERPDSRPGVALGLAFLAVFLVVIVAAIVLGVVG